MERQEAHSQVIKSLENLSPEALREVHLFLDFLQMREKMKLGMGDIEFDLSVLDESERRHLEHEFENYREQYPHEQ